MKKELRPLIAGNWKMNGLGESLSQLQAVAAYAVGGGANLADLLFCVPATLLDRAKRSDEKGVLLFGGQNCHSMAAGAYTGEISAAMLQDAGAEYVILGHSERRQYYYEDNALICQKRAAAEQAGLITILCVGETYQQRVAQQTLSVIALQLQECLKGLVQLDKIVIAYEPLWAIGQGKAAQPQDVEHVHSFMRKLLVGWFGESAANVRLLYGGSVNGENASALLCLPHVNGALVGGASLCAEDFIAICEAYRKL